MNSLRSVLISLVGAFVIGVSHAGESPPTEAKLCGWFLNPTPGNAWLLDRSGEWLISIQGGAEAEGDWPNFKASQWIETNGHHGYGCACMQVLADASTRRIAVIKSAHAQSLAVCQKDRSLKTPP